MRHKQALDWDWHWPFSVLHRNRLIATASLNGAVFFFLPDCLLFGSKEWKPSQNKGVRNATGTSKRFNMMQLDAMQCQTPATGLQEAGVFFFTEGNKFNLAAWTESDGCHYFKLILPIFRIRLQNVVWFRIRQAHYPAARLRDCLYRTSNISMRWNWGAIVWHHRNWPTRWEME